MAPDTAIVHSRALLGIEAPAVTIETHLGTGLPGFSVVGLPEAAVREARDRVKSAINTSADFEFPSNSKITVNLAPADLPKEGGRFDLGIALSILIANGNLPQAPLDAMEVIGELGLFGEVRPVRGALSAAIGAAGAGRRLMLPWPNRREAALLRDIALHPVRGLAEASACLRTGGAPAVVAPEPRRAPARTDTGLDVVRGQTVGKRALVVAAAGAHNLLMSGPPGAGKTLLARALSSLLPPLSDAEVIEVMRVYSAAGHDWDHRRCERPFRDPHHHASPAAIVGGGLRTINPGEISLAHCGVLFLDELPEFDRRVLEALRQPLESHEIVVARANARVRFPARFQLIAAMNPCPAGRACQQRDCICSPDQIRRYRSRLSAPLLDRIDLQIYVQPLPSAVLLAQEPETLDLAALQRRIRRARRRQQARSGKPNQYLSAAEVPRVCALARSDRQLLIRAAEHHRLSGRACHRLLKVARTIADLDDRTDIVTDDLIEALSYRLPADAGP